MWTTSRARSGPDGVVCRQTPFGNGEAQFRFPPAATGRHRQHPFVDSGGSAFHRLLTA